MKNFTSVYDVKDLAELVQKTLLIKDKVLCEPKKGLNKTLGLIFMNPSLRTRLSTQKAAQNLGMEVIVMNFGSEGWALETSDGVIMDGDKAEHIKEATAVVGQYCDIIGIRSFPALQNREKDYSEEILNSFIKYSGKPIVSLESATRHPLQSLADIVTIEKNKSHEKPKVVMSWAPHPRALPQSVPNSFLEWTSRMDYDLVITHPEGYELSPEFMKGVQVEYDQDKALEGSDFVYVKNWSSYKHYGKILSQDKSWMISQKKLRNSNNAKVMHCLPARRNVVISDDILDSNISLVIEEAGNREFAAQAALSKLLDYNK
jgi:N-succinyl-L-ornithine transcarbamylase